jgi:hypothetical protein
MYSLIKPKTPLKLKYRNPNIYVSDSKAQTVEEFFKNYERSKI